MSSVELKSDILAEEVTTILILILVLRSVEMEKIFTIMPVMMET